MGGLSVELCIYGAWGPDDTGFHPIYYGRALSFVLMKKIWRYRKSEMRLALYFFRSGDRHGV